MTSDINCKKSITYCYNSEASILGQVSMKIDKSILYFLSKSSQIDQKLTMILKKNSIYMLNNNIQVGYNWHEIKDIDSEQYLSLQTTDIGVRNE